MDLISSATFSLDAPIVDVDSVAADKAVASGAIGAKDAASVDEIVVETIGITFAEEVATSTCFN